MLPLLPPLEPPLLPLVLPLPLLPLLPPLVLPLLLDDCANGDVSLPPHAAVATAATIMAIPPTGDGLDTNPPIADSNLALANSIFMAKAPFQPSQSLSDTLIARRSTEARVTP